MRLYGKLCNFFLIFLLKFDLIYLTRTTRVSREAAAPGNSPPKVYWKLEFHAVTWWEKQL